MILGWLLACTSTMVARANTDVPRARLHEWRYFARITIRRSKAVNHRNQFYTFSAYGSETLGTLVVYLFFTPWKKKRVCAPFRMFDVVLSPNSRQRYFWIFLHEAQTLTEPCSLSKTRRPLNTWLSSRRRRVIPTFEWTADPRGSHTFATHTHLILDHFPFCMNGQVKSPRLLNRILFIYFWALRNLHSMQKHKTFWRGAQTFKHHRVRTFKCSSQEERFQHSHTEQCLMVKDTQNHTEPKSNIQHPGIFRLIRE